MANEIGWAVKFDCGRQSLVTQRFFSIALSLSLFVTGRFGSYYFGESERVETCRRTLKTLKIEFRTPGWFNSMKRSTSHQWMGSCKLVARLLPAICWLLYSVTFFGKNSGETKNLIGSTWQSSKNLDVLKISVVYELVDWFVFFFRSFGDTLLARRLLLAETLLPGAVAKFSKLTKWMVYWISLEDDSERSADGKLRMSSWRLLPARRAEV